MLERLYRVAGLGIAVALTAALSGCGVTSQLHSELSYNGTGADVLFAADGIGVLTPAAPTGQESDKQALGDAVGSALQLSLIHI